MQHLHSEIEIGAPAQRVWHVLTDFAAYSSWNPFIRAIRGDLSLGARLEVTIHPDGGKAMSFKPKLVALELQKELRWKGRLLLPGVFDGEHYFQLNSTSAGSVRFVQGERFSGLLVPLVLRGSMLAGTLRGFAAMNQALKARAEALQ